MSDWIPVKESLPEKFRNVLTFSKLGQIVIACVDSSGILDDYPLTDEGDEFTHWMPLPEPPKP